VSAYAPITNNFPPVSTAELLDYVSRLCDPRAIIHKNDLRLRGITFQAFETAQGDQRGIMDRHYDRHRCTGYPLFSGLFENPVTRKAVAERPHP
jgi:hypothetical protein